MNNLRCAAHENEMLPWPTEEERNRNSPWQVTWSLSYFSSGVVAFLRLDLVFNHIQTSSHFLFRTPHKRDISRLLLIFWHQDSSVNLSSFQISSVSITCFGSDFTCRYGQATGTASTSTWGGTEPSPSERVSTKWIYLACISAALLIDTLFSSPDSCPPRTHRLFVVPPRYRCLNSPEFFRFLLRTVCVLSCRAESRLINAFISGPN